MPDVAMCAADRLLLPRSLEQLETMHGIRGHDDQMLSVTAAYQHLSQHLYMKCLSLGAVVGLWGCKQP